MFTEKSLNLTVNMGGDYLQLRYNSVSDWDLPVGIRLWM